MLMDLNAEDTKSAVQYLLKVYGRLTIVKTLNLSEQTMTIAQTLKLSIYDALYATLAQRENGTLYTADKKLAITANTITKTKLLKPN